MPGDGRVVVVTGAGSGIGAETARRFAAAGDDVWVLDLHGGRVVADVSDVSSVAVAFDRIVTSSGRIDVLVNCAGITAVGDVESTTVELFERVWRVNVLGVLNCLQAALPGLRAAPPPARVLNVASVAATKPSPFLAAYAASKAAVVSLTRSAAMSLAPRILVNAVSPGAIRTPMWDVVAEELEQIDAPRARSVEERGAGVPLGRPGEPGEVAELLFALAGPAGSYMTGEDVQINGGSSMC